MEEKKSTWMIGASVFVYIKEVEGAKKQTLRHTSS